MRQKSSNNIFKSIIPGILITPIFVFAGYILSGAIGYQLDYSVSFSDAFLHVLQDPLGDYFNNYSPIFMIFGFIIAEIIFFFVFCRKDFVSAVSGNTRKEEELAAFGKRSDDDMSPFFSDNDSVESKESSIEDSGPSDRELFRSALEKNKGKRSSSDNGLKDSDMLPDGVPDTAEHAADSAAENKSRKTSSEDVSEEDAEEMYFDEDMMFELTSVYSIEQIKAMLHIKKYIKNIDSKTLKLMYPPTMSSGEILSSINLFYGD